MKKVIVIALVALLVSMVTYGQSWDQGAGILYTNPSSTKVGIGTNDPREQLHVYGGFYVGGWYDIDMFGLKIKPYYPYKFKIETENCGGLDISSRSLTLKSYSAKITLYNNVDINTNLFVNGEIKTKKITVTLDGWSDFVFADNYKLMPLDKLAEHIKTNKSLPGIPTEKEVLENGIELGDIQTKLLKKVEELTLYVIELKKENEELRELISALNK